MKYKLHFDWISKQWNLFRVVNGREDYVCSYPIIELKDALAFVNAANAEESHAATN